MRKQDEQMPTADDGPVERMVRPLREGEVMGAYMEFDRSADRRWSSADYLVRFGLYVSERTAAVNGADRRNGLKVPLRELVALKIECDRHAERSKAPPCMECGAETPEQAETMCNCGGDKDDCHGCRLWPVA